MRKLSAAGHRSGSVVLSKTNPIQNKKHAGRGPAMWYGLEALEGRALLSGVVDAPAEAAVSAQLVPGFLDNLDLSFTSKFTTQVVAGQATKGSVAISVTNAGADALAADAKGTVSLVARPTGGGDDIPLGAKPNQSLAKLKTTKSKKVSISFTLPATVAIGDYSLVAVFTPDGGGDRLEKVSPAPFHVRDPFVDLTVTVDGGKLPAALTSGDGTKLKLPIAVGNAGNVALDKTAVIDIGLALRPVGAVDDTGDIPLDPITNQKVGKLAPGKLKKVAGKPLIPAGIPAGAALADYVLVAKVDSTHAITESDETNNAAATAQQIAVTKGFINLTPLVTGVSLPPSIVDGDTLDGSVAVTLKNTGIVALPKNVKVDLKLVAQPAVGNAIDLATLDDQNVGGLKADGIKKLTFKLKSVAVPNGDYTLKVVADTGGDVAESNELDNEVLVPQQLSVAPAFTDLAVKTATHTLAANVETGDTGKTSVVVENRGNNAVEGDVDVLVFATANGVIDCASVQIGSMLTQHVKLDVGQSKPFSVDLTVAPSLNGDFTIVAKVVPSQGSALVDTKADNDAGAAANTIHVAKIVPILGEGWGTKFKFTRVGGANEGQNVFRSIGGFDFMAETGTFVDELGHSGTYSLVWNNQNPAADFGGVLQLVYNAGPDVPTTFPIPRAMDFTDQHIHSFNGKTVVFGAGFAGELGIISVGSGVPAEFKFA